MARKKKESMNETTMNIIVDPSLQNDDNVNKFGVEINSRSQTPEFTPVVDDFEYPAIVDYANTAFKGNSLRLPSTDKKLIEDYRALSRMSPITKALEFIEDETFINDVPNKKPVRLVIKPNSKLSPKLQKQVIESFEHIHDILDFQENCTSLFMDWYIDSIICLHKITNEKRLTDGIIGYARIDPTNIIKVKEIPKPDDIGIIDRTKIKEYYYYLNAKQNMNNTNSVYRLSGRSANSNYDFHASNSLKLPKDAITYVDSGMKDRTTGATIGYLQDVIAPFNRYSLMLDSMIVFRITRAPSRLLVYVDVGGIQPKKAMEKLQQVQRSMQSKVGYDTSTGTLTDQRNILSLTENYFMTRNGEGKTTEIQQLQGGDFDGVLDETNYFKNELFYTLKVPMSRLDPERAAPAMFGRGTTELSREEYVFKKFISKIRRRFMHVFDDMIRTHMLLKKYIADESDWKLVRDNYDWEYTEDNLFIELKENEIMASRFALANDVLPYADRKMISYTHIQKEILRMSDEEILAERKQIEKDSKWYHYENNGLENATDAIETQDDEQTNDNVEETSVYDDLEHDSEIIKEL